MKKAQYWIKHLQLKRHPEGGYFAEKFRSEEKVQAELLGKHTNGERSLATHIYFLVDFEGFSAFHILDADELWHFYAGDPLLLHLIHKDGSYEKILLGGEEHPFFCLVPAGIWFAAEVLDEKAYALVGCTMAPAFDFGGFKLGERVELQAQFPQHTALIERLSRMQDYSSST